ncbi:MAG: hypothetical protein JHC95_10405 [Solirubrobacteraceae bacterium]|nr:hypothetical protein [Solirubrobacteraceae bacterium]
MDPREDMDELVDYLLSFAEHQIRARGEFFPFAAAMTADGEVAAVAVDMGDDHPDPSDVIDGLIEALRAATDTRAVGICVDVRVEGPDGMTDAARAIIEHRDADPVAVFLPYRRKRLRGCSFGELFASPADPLVYA